LGGGRGNKGDLLKRRKRVREYNNKWGTTSKGPMRSVPGIDKGSSWTGEKVLEVPARSNGNTQKLRILIEQITGAMGERGGNTLDGANSLGTPTPSASVKRAEREKKNYLCWKGKGWSPNKRESNASVQAITGGVIRIFKETLTRRGVHRRSLKNPIAAVNRRSEKS